MVVRDFGGEDFVLVGIPCIAMVLKRLFGKFVRVGSLLLEASRRFLLLMILDRGLCSNVCVFEGEND
mgnify:CR=1 FL=1